MYLAKTLAAVRLAHLAVAGDRPGGGLSGPSEG